MKVWTADCRKMSAAEFAAMFTPRPDPLDVLCGQWWAAMTRGDIAECHRLTAEIKALGQASILELEARRNDDGSYTVAA